MVGYYTEKLSAGRLKKVYDLAPPRVRQYLEAEIEFVLAGIGPGDRTLELGAGYGRVLGRLIAKTPRVYGIDLALDSLALAGRLLPGLAPGRLLVMDAADLAFRDESFDKVVCVQNGASAFHVDPVRLFREAARVLRPGGSAFFSSYSASFWPHRLDWFRLQSQHGLLGRIDEQATGGGVIVCEDGFRAVTFSPDDFRAATGSLGLTAALTEVDGSSLFCEIVKKSAP
ncbi:MAG: class I SAM-dependent methyltransferase [Pseudomonadota bacterium]